MPFVSSNKTFVFIDKVPSRLHPKTVGLDSQTLNWYRDKYGSHPTEQMMAIIQQIPVSWSTATNDDDDDASESDYAIGYVPKTMDTDEFRHLGIGLLEQHPDLPACMHMHKTKAHTKVKNVSGPSEQVCIPALRALRQNMHAVFELYAPHCAQHQKYNENERKSFRCDCLGLRDTENKSRCLADSIPPAHPLTTRKGIKAAECARPASERFASERKSGLPVIAVLVGSVSHGAEFLLPLAEKKIVKLFLTSLGKTIETGYEYRVYLAIGIGDLFFDDVRVQTQLLEWFEIAVSAPNRARGITIELKILRFFNVLMMQGPVYNYIKECAFVDGADFFYRQNDDVELRTPWAHTFVRALEAMHPSMVGMVGPSENGMSPPHAYRHDEPHLSLAQRHANMVVDFTHRTHHYIHRIHYPVVFTGWFTDGYINRLYMPLNLQRLHSAEIIHHAFETTYTIEGSRAIWMVHELERGTRRVNAFKHMLAANESWHPGSLVTNFCPSSEIIARYREAIGRREYR